MQTVAVATADRVPAQIVKGCLAPIKETPQLEGNGKLAIFGNTLSTAPEKNTIVVTEVNKNNISVTLKTTQHQLIQPGIYRYEITPIMHVLAV